ncbi:MAG: sel1 repeat family protein [Lawsonibacter sp.]|nr:sel1 repeat family protein [Lawsonibacter sp.]
MFKCPHIKGGSEKATAHLGNYVRYAATRDGVEHVDPGKTGLPATEKQARLVEQLLRDFPSSRGLFEYEDYQDEPTRGNASEFITRAIEDNYEQVAKKENYVDYIANRPRVHRVGAHGLFTADDSPLALSQVADEVAHHPGVLWLPIISLRREDAARLGYDSAERWRKLLSAHAMDLAKAMKIPDAQFRWYAAFHDEGHHPHLHMVCYSADTKSGFLTKRGIADIKSMLAKEIFQQDLIAVYQRQTQRRDELTQSAGEIMAQLVTEMQAGAVENRHIGQLIAELAQRLRDRSGKKQYGYLPPSLKSLVDEVVNELEKDPCAAAAYDLWYQEREEVLRTYKDDLPQRDPLVRQKEFKRIKNIIVQEAARLGDLIPSGLADQAEGEPADGPSDSSPADDPSDAGRASSPTWWTRRYRAARQLMAGDADSPPDFAAAFDLLTGEADAGNALAMIDLGRMYADGLGREPDPELSHQWYAKALAAFLEAEKNAPDRVIQYRIGKLYAAGLGADQDYEEAACWLEKSADAGYKYAQYTLAGLYRDGKGVEQDYTAARELYAKASTFPYAAYELGKLYRDGLGGEADENRAARYFRQAFLGFQFLADRSPDDKLQYRIGWMLLHGVGTEQDEAAARPWLEKAAQGGNPFAKYQLGKLLLSGTGTVPKDVERALELLTGCAGDGDQYAQYTLGKAYLLGQDIPQDREQAVRWLKLSAEQGNQYAQYFLDRVYGSLFSSTASLLYHMGRIFQEQRPQPVAGIQIAVDSKLRQRIREKKIAMGHKPNDHEDQVQQM